MTLSVRDLRAFYGKSQVLFGVDLDVRPASIMALLGRNGVGRSTTLKAIIGEVAATGSVSLSGREVIGRPTHAIARAGVGYVPENRDVFPDLTVMQNLALGERAARVDGASAWTVDEMLERFPRLAERRGVAAGSLSGGEQQMLAICRSLVGNPAFLLVDEPTEGLAPKIVEEVGALLTSVARRGTGVLLVEQKLAIALEISDRVAVMGRGKIVFEGTPRDLAAAPDVARDWMAV